MPAPAELPDVLGEPAGEHARDLEIVFFEHHHMAVAMDAAVAELYPHRMNAGLFQVFDRAMVVGRMVGSLPVTIRMAGF